MTERNVLLLGVGMVGRAVADLFKPTSLQQRREGSTGPSTKVTGTTRDPQRIFQFADLGIEPIIMPWPSAEVIEPLARGADVVVSFPPDGTTDALLAPACADANSIVYVSSTGVYGSYCGAVDESTLVAATEDGPAARLEAEDIWRAQGATVLRAPAIYGPTSGVHIRLKEGSYAIPGDGSGIVSRIHVHDLARLIVSAMNKKLRSETFVVGDLKPASHSEVVAWLCERMNLPMPPSVPLESVSPHLRANRSVNASRSLKELDMELAFPTYKEGFSAILQL